MVTKKKFTILDFRAAVQLNKSENKEWRVGQCMFNTLHRLNPDLANEIRSDWDIDPFYNDLRIPAFLMWLEEKLQE